MKISTHPLGPDLDLPRVQIDVGSAVRLRASFAALESQLDRFADLFFDVLFTAEPALRPLFQTDMPTQKRKLLEMLQWIADRLEDRAELQTTLRALGARHVQYHVLPRHYPVFVDALLVAMSEVAGDAWNDQSRVDWRTALERIAEIMLGKP